MSAKKESKIKEVPQKKKYPFWFYLIALALPLVLILLLEIGLRIGGYGVEFKVFDTVNSAYPDKLYLNPAIARKYFVSLQNPPTPVADGFDIEKKENTFRIFVLGESSAAGWPYIPNASFPRQLKRKLDALYPSANIEVINLGMSAINTYTLRDFTDALIEHKPDLVLIYTGHNEYYGALGVASAQSVAAFPFFNKLYLSLIEFRSVQLLRSMISSLMGTLSKLGTADSGEQNETLMSRMVGENLIPLNSSLYKAGLKQFESNMSDILSELKGENIPVVISTLASNLSGIKPFESVKDAGIPSAGQVYKKGSDQLNQGDTISAKKSFIYAKDLDALRFRAPSEFNEIIKRLSAEFSVPLADAESVMNANSPGDITGNNLMVDHLHPDISGYKLIAEEFFRLMSKNNYLPDAPRASVSGEELDHKLVSEFPFTRLDSVIAELRIKILIGAYPFKPKNSTNELLKNYIPRSLTDSLAMMVVDRLYTLDEAHGKLAERFWEERNFAGAAREINVLISEKPFNKRNYEQLIDMLIAAKQYDLAIPYLFRYERIGAGAYTNKWLGAIYLDKGDHIRALEFLQKSYSFDQRDPQLLYNLAGAYYLNSRIKEAYEAIKQCLAVNPRNQAALQFYSQLRPLAESAR